MIRPIMGLCLCLGLASAGLAGEFSSSAKAMTTANFLEIGAGARAMALGEAYTALAQGAEALYWNPAGLRGAPMSATLMHATYLDSSFFDYASYARNLGAAGAMGLGVQYFSAGRFPGTDASGADIGSFTPNDLALTLGAAYRPALLGGASLGMGLKYVRSHIVTDAQTAAADLGLMSPVYLGQRLRLAAAVKNLGGAMKFDSAREPLPLALKLGSAYQITQRWLAALDASLPRGNGPSLGAGTEYRWPVQDWVVLAGRAGYNTRTAADVAGLSGLSLGFGLGFPRLDVDYGFGLFGDLGLVHRLSLSYRMGPSRSKVPKEKGHDPGSDCSPFLLWSCGYQ